MSKKKRHRKCNCKGKSRKIPNDSTLFRDIRECVDRCADEFIECAGQCEGSPVSDCIQRCSRIANDCTRRCIDPSSI